MAPVAFGMYMVSLIRKGKAGPVEPAAAPAWGPARPCGRSFQDCVPTRPVWKSFLLLDALHTAGALPARSNCASSPAALLDSSATSSKRRSRAEAISADFAGVVGSACVAGAL